MRINQNSMAINAYRNLSTNNVSLGKSLEKLSSGFRINRAADDAAGLVISQNLRAQVSGLRQATRNAQDGISVVQTAEGALNEVHTMLNRMRDLSVQAANSGANDSAARSAAQAEITELNAEITRIAESTSFGGTKLLDGNYGTTATTTTGPTAAAAAADETLAITVDGVSYSGGLAITNGDSAATTGAAVAAAVNTLSSQTGVTATADATTGQLSFTNTEGAAADVVFAGTVLNGTTTAAAATGTAKQFQIGANSSDVLSVSIAGVSSEDLGIDTVNVTTDAGAAAAIDAFDAAISSVSAQRGNLGAVQNRFESMINNLQVTTENLVASESRIRDTDMAAEMTSFTKSQILSQASTAMLAQANQVPQSVLSLLR